MRVTSQMIGGRTGSNISDRLTDPSYLPPWEYLFLECWTCSKLKKIPNGSYSSGKKFKLASVCRKNGWKSGVDFKKIRMLAFCSDECMDKAKIRNGNFKPRRPA